MNNLELLTSSILWIWLVQQCCLTVAFQVHERLYKIKIISLMLLVNALSAFSAYYVALCVYQTYPFWLMLVLLLLYMSILQSLFWMPYLNTHEGYTLLYALAAVWVIVACSYGYLWLLHMIGRYGY